MQGRDLQLTERGDGQPPQPLGMLMSGFTCAQDNPTREAGPQTPVLRRFAASIS
jgi:hypothetical protein